MSRIDEGKRWTEKAASLTSTLIGPAAADVDREGRFPVEAVAALRESGLFGLCIPEALGGLGQGPGTFAAVTFELARGCASTAMVYVMHVTAAQALVASTTLGNKEALLRAVARGELLCTLAFSEQGSRSHFWAPVSQLVERDDGFVTVARKSWVTSAHHADLLIASGLRPGAASPLDSTVYLVKRGAKGTLVSGSYDGLGLRGNDSAPMFFEGIQVSNEALLTEQGAGAQLMLETVLPFFAMGTSAMANGLSHAAVECTAQHLREAGLEHTGQKLRDLPTLRARLAEMSVRTEQASALLERALGELERASPSATLSVLRTRMSALQTAVEVTDLAMKACGGAAYSRRLPIERLFRDARAGWVMAPTVDQLADFIGRALTGLPLFG